MSTGRALHVLSARGGNIYGVAIGPRDEILAACKPGAVDMWNLQTGQLLTTLQATEISGRDVCFSNDGKVVVTTGKNGHVDLWNVEKRTLIRRLSGHIGAVKCVRFSPDGSLLASAGDDATVRLWNPLTGQLKGFIAGHSGPVSSICFARDGMRIASGEDAGMIRIWHLPDGRLLRVLSSQQGGVEGIGFVDDGKVLAMASDDQVCLWDASYSRPRLPLKVVSFAGANTEIIVAIPSLYCSTWNWRNESVLESWRRSKRYSSLGKRDTARTKPTTNPAKNKSKSPTAKNKQQGKHRDDI